MSDEKVKTNKYMKHYMKDYRTKVKQLKTRLNNFLLANLNSDAITFSNDNGVILSYANFIIIDEIPDNDNSKEHYKAYIAMLDKSTFKTNYDLEFRFKND